MLDQIQVQNQAQISLEEPTKIILNNQWKMSDQFIHSLNLRRIKMEIYF